MTNSQPSLIESLKLMIEAISPNRFLILKAEETEDGLRFYVKPKSIDAKYSETDALVYDLIWHVENSTKPISQ